MYFYKIVVKLHHNKNTKWKNKHKQTKNCKKWNKAMQIPHILNYHHINVKPLFSQQSFIPWLSNWALHIDSFNYCKCPRNQINVVTITLKNVLRKIILMSWKNLEQRIKVGFSPSQKICFICFNESPLKVMKNIFYLILKALFGLVYMVM